MNPCVRATASDWPRCVEPSTVVLSAVESKLEDLITTVDGVQNVPSAPIEEKVNVEAMGPLDDEPTANKLTNHEWLMQRFADHAIPGVFPPNPNDLIDDATEIAFGTALSIRPELLPLCNSASTKIDSEVEMRDNIDHAATKSMIDTTVQKLDQVSRPRKRRRAEAEAGNLNGSALLFAPVGAAAAEVGLPKAVVQRWLADEQVAFIRPRPNNSHRLVDMQDLRRYLEHKRSRVNTARSHTRVLVYALVEPATSDSPRGGKTDRGDPTRVAKSEALTPDSESSESNSDTDSETLVNRHIVSQVQNVAEAMHLEPGKYMYNGDIADADDWSNRPCFDLMVDKIVSREIHTIAVATLAHLARGSALLMLQQLCLRNGVEIKCVRQE